MLILGLEATIQTIFPPFPMPGFVPNFTGYDLDQQNIDWLEMYKSVSTDDEPVYVRTIRISVFSSVTSNMCLVKYFSKLS